MFNVDANYFRACAVFQSTEATRYYLAGVHIEPHPKGGALLVATDGHRALMAHDPKGETDGMYIVQFDKAALAACKPDRRDGDRRIVSTVPGEPVYVVDAAGEQLHMVRKWQVDGTFPDWRRVMPQAGTPSNAGYNASYLASFETVASILNGGPRGDKRITIAPDASGPALIRFACTDKVFGVLMPLRGPEPVMPDWMATA